MERIKKRLVICEFICCYFMYVYASRSSGNSSNSERKSDKARYYTTDTPTDRADKCGLKL